jgi:hypothetical protein
VNSILDNQLKLQRAADDLWDHGVEEVRVKHPHITVEHLDAHGLRFRLHLKGTVEIKGDTVLETIRPCNGPIRRLWDALQRQGPR